MMTRQEAARLMREIKWQIDDDLYEDQAEAFVMAIDALSVPLPDDTPQETDYNSYMVRCGECRFRKDGVCELTMAEMPDEFYCKDGRKNG